MRIIISSSRTFTDRNLLYSTLDRLTKKLKKVIVISGHATGADQMGEQWGLGRGYTCEIYHADWDKYKDKAGPIRNSEMVEKANALVAFWDGKSPGTKDIIRKARKMGLKVKVILFKEKK